MEKYLTIIFVISFTSVLINSCLEEKISEAPEKIHNIRIPEQIDDGWETASLQDAGISESNISDMMTYIQKRTDHQIHSILIIKDSKLVFEEYFSGYYFDTDEIDSRGEFIQYDKSTLHFMASVSKSVTSAFFGIAVENGIVQDLDKRLLEYYPGYSNVLRHQKAKITIRHLLNMSAGLSWDEWTYPYTDLRNDITQLFNNPDPIKYILEKKLESEPGIEFNYNSGYTNILADIIRTGTGKSSLDFAKNYLFEPLGIKEFRWDLLRRDYLFASGGLYLCPRDLAKIGSLYLNEGKWNGIQVLSKSWIDQSLKNYIIPDFGDFANGYGFQWWSNTIYIENKKITYFMAAGWGEQLMFIIPYYEMIVVINCGYFISPVTVSPHVILWNYILRAI